MTLTSFYGDLLYQTDQYRLIKTHLSKIVDRMLEGLAENHSFIFKEINNYHPDHLGKPIDELNELHLSIEDCKTTIAYEYGYSNWETVLKLQDQYDQDFEKAVNFLVSGNFKELKKLIFKDPELVTKRSKYGPRATLLHYTTSNGVEMWRQKAPLNLPEMTQFLIDQGADRKCTMKVYGGDFDTFTLLKSSVHPFEAGIGEQMLTILQ